MMSTSNTKTEFKWLSVPSEQMPGVLILLHLLIIIFSGTLLSVAWYRNILFNGSPLHAFEVGLIGISFLFTTLSLCMNFGCWIPLMMIGMAIGSTFPSAWSGSLEYYFYAKFKYLILGMFFGGMLGVFIEFLRRSKMGRRRSANWKDLDPGGF